MTSGKARRQIETLQRRLAWLNERIENENGKRLDYDRRERAALRWTLSILEVAEGEGILDDLDARRGVLGPRTHEEQQEVDDLVLRGVVAVQKLRDAREAIRREASRETFGHTGAHIPEAFVSTEDEVRAVIEAVL